MLACGGLRRADGCSQAILARKVADCRELPAKNARLCEAAGGFESGERFAYGSHIVNSNDLHALHGQTQRRADIRIGSVRFFIADEFRQEPFARMADKNRTTKRVKFATMPHQRNIVFVGFSKTDSGVEADALA